LVFEVPLAKEKIKASHRTQAKEKIKASHRIKAAHTKEKITPRLCIPSWYLSSWYFLKKEVCEAFIFSFARDTRKKHYAQPSF